MNQTLLRKILTHDALWFAARCLMVFIFFASGIFKLLNIDGAGYAEMAAAGLDPVWLFNYLTAFTLLVASLLILLDRLLWLGAAMISVFLILSIFIVHHFWKIPGQPGLDAMYISLEHFTVIGGLISASMFSELRKILKEQNISLI